MATEIVRRNGNEVLKNGIKAVHEAFADYVLMNPGATLREIAEYYGYTASWVCTVMNTDMFKAYMAERRGQISIAVAEDLPSKLLAAGHILTERLIEVAVKTEDAELIVDSFDKVMHRLGYAPKSGAAPQQQAQNIQNNFYLDKNEFASARETLLRSHQAPAPLPAPREAAEDGVDMPAA